VEYTANGCPEYDHDTIPNLPGPFVGKIELDGGTLVLADNGKCEDETYYVATNNY
jgi:hypothetical protein